MVLLFKYSSPIALSHHFSRQRKECFLRQDQDAPPRQAQDAPWRFFRGAHQPVRWDKNPPVWAPKRSEGVSLDFSGQGVCGPEKDSQRDFLLLFFKKSRGIRKKYNQFPHPAGARLRNARPFLTAVKQYYPVIGITCFVFYSKKNFIVLRCRPSRARKWGGALPGYRGAVPPGLRVDVLSNSTTILKCLILLRHRQSSDIKNV